MAGKRALCIGINYNGTDAQLNGCLNDATDWAENLHRAGYEATTLLEADATKANMMEAMRREVSLLRRGGRLIVTYSGHGTWVPDWSGDEIDGRDEALCPIDFTNGNLITDDELNDLFAGYPFGSGVLMISDSCHSGTLARGIVMPTTPTDATRKPRFISPADFLDTITETKAVAAEAAVDVNAPRRTTSLISGCADQEYSYDASFGGRGNGAMSRAAIDSYRPGMTLNNWYKEIRKNLPSAYFPQTPQLTAANYYRKHSKAV